jgi:hypothetical protein
MDCFAEPVIGRRYCADPLARNDDVEASAATNQPDGQISQSLSSPELKNIPLSSSGKSLI